MGGCEESACQGVLDDIIFVPKTAAQGDWAVKQGVDGRAELDGGIPDFQNGLVRRMRRLSTEEVLDGLSSTYMIGEKYVPPERTDGLLPEHDEEEGAYLYPWSAFCCYEKTIFALINIGINFFFSILNCIKSY